MSHPRIRIALLLACSGAVLGTTVVAVGQERATRGGARAETAAPEAEPADEEATESSEADAEDAEEDGATAESDVVEVGGERVKVFRFSGLDISGRLKSPQLLYFMNRLRAEFDRPRLPHRSFMPELRRSAESKALR